MNEMTLHWSPRSPFVRKVMVAAHELGVADQITLVRTVVTMSQPNPVIMACNPLGRIPALIRADGMVLMDSGVICEYLDSIAGSGHIIPMSGDARWQELSRHAAATGILEILVLWRHERDRPPESRKNGWMESFALKTDRSLARFERDLRGLSSRPLALSCITLGCVLSYLDFRFPDLEWRASFPSLRDWHADFCLRPSAIASKVVDDG